MKRNGPFLIRLSFCILIFSSLLSPYAFGAKQDKIESSTPFSPDMGAVTQTPPVTAVVTASRREVPIEKISRFVTVIPREEIERSGKRFVLDLLRGTPGLSINQSGPPGRTVDVHLRGTNANQTLVLLDGVQINTPNNGQANLAHITTEGIDRIEILRGPQSVLYGADAVGGVINIITKAGRGKGWSGETRFEYGTHETFYESGNLSGVWDDFSFSGDFGRIDSEGPGGNDGYQNTTARTHSNLQLTENSDLDVAFHYYNSYAGIDDGSFLQDPNRYSKSREQTLNSKYTFWLLPEWEQYLQFSFFHDSLFDLDPRNPGAGGADPESRFKIDTDRYTSEYQSNIYLGEVDVLTFGYEFEFNNTVVKRSQASGGFDGLLRNHGVFLQNELTLWEIWSFVGGVRIDHNNFFGTVVSPMISTGYWIRKNLTKLKASFGRAYKAPTLNELSFPGFGNPALSPEDSWGWDAGVEQYYWDKKGSLSAAFFRNDIENLIQFVTVSGSTKPVNVAMATTQGVELEHRVAPWKGLSLYQTYTYTSAVDDETHKRLTRRPWHHGKLGVSYQFRKLTAAADWVFIGDKEELVGSSRVRTKGYTRLDLSLFYDVTDYFQIYGRVENATDDHYFEVRGFDIPTSRFFVGTKVKV